MPSRNRYTATLFTAGAAFAFVALAPVAAAAPECRNVGPNTTQCQTNGSAQIVTSPEPTSGWGGVPYWFGGGLVIGFGGWGW